ncbi:MAG TPA: MoxR family ATPase [Acidimicrobiales bacterium]|nr:MoxR family ATPase [Acidimicrobiales bacterium]
MSSQSSAVEALGIAVAAQVPVLLWGAPGTGKSSAVRAMADAIGWPCETVIAAIREPSDFSGLPVVAGGAVHFAPPRWAERLAAAGHGVLFLDEISTAPPAVQAALLRVVLERVVGDLDLPPGVVVVAAANPPEQSADGWDLSAPLANRFCHLQWEVDAAGVARGFSSGFETPPVPSLPAGWEEAVDRRRADVAAFITVRPALTVHVPEDAAAAGRGWPSPRTWDMAARLWAAADAAGASVEATTALITGCVGDGPGVELLVWDLNRDLPDPEAVLADPDGVELPEEPDRAYTVLSAVAAAVEADPTPERWQAGWRALVRAGTGAPDVVALPARTLARCRPKGVVAPPEMRLFGPILKEADLLQ